MHMTAGPDFTGLGFVGGAAEQEASESRAVKRKEGPEVAEAREGRGSQIETVTSVRPIRNPGNPQSPVVTTKRMR